MGYMGRLFCFLPTQKPARKTPLWGDGQRVYVWFVIYYPHFFPIFGFPLRYGPGIDVKCLWSESTFPCEICLCAKPKSLMEKVCWRCQHVSFDPSFTCWYPNFSMLVGHQCRCLPPGWRAQARESGRKPPVLLSHIKLWPTSLYPERQGQVVFYGLLLSEAAKTPVSIRACPSAGSASWPGGPDISAAAWMIWRQRVETGRSQWWWVWGLGGEEDLIFCVSARYSLSPLIHLSYKSILTNQVRTLGLQQATTKLCQTSPA